MIPRLKEEYDRVIIGNLVARVRFPPPPPTCYLSHQNAKGIGYTNLTIILHQNKMDMDHHIYQQNLNVKQHFRFSDLN